MDKLAKESKLNKAMIFYYFKNKQGLYEEVIIKVLNDIYNAVLDENKKNSNATDKLKGFIACFSNYAWKHPALSSLLLRELSKNSDISHTLFLNMKKLYQLFCDILLQGTKDGVFINSTDTPMPLYFMITGTINLMTTTKNIRVETNKNSDLNTNIEFNEKSISSYLIKQIIPILTTKIEDNIMVHEYPKKLKEI